jgi:predicted Zn-dependent protease with MMP-like domain
MRVGAPRGTFFFCAAGLGVRMTWSQSGACACAAPAGTSMSAAATDPIAANFFMPPCTSETPVRNVADRRPTVNVPSRVLLAALPPSRKNTAMTPPFPMQDWRAAQAPSLEEFERMADEAYRQLPEDFRSLCKDLVVRVDDYATDEVLDSMGIGSELELTGLFQGVGLPFQSVSDSGQMPNMVWLYRVPILLEWAERDEPLGKLIAHVLVHEIGHHFGLSDEDIQRIEDAVE